MRCYRAAILSIWKQGLSHDAAPVKALSNDITVKDITYSVINDHPPEHYLLRPAFETISHSIDRFDHDNWNC